MTEKRDSIGTQEIKKMMAMTGIFTGRRRIHALVLCARPRQFFRKERGMSPVHEMLHPPIGLDLSGPFLPSSAYERHSSASLKGKFPNGPKSDF
jgi:hypothetical protein